jgi:hypothetical protein
MRLPNLTSADILAILDREHIEIRAKEDPIWYHAPIIWIQIAIVWMSGRDPSSFSMTLPTIWGGAVVYLSGYDVDAITRGDAPLSSMPLVVHELTHAYQILELGPIVFGFYYAVWPLPSGWTTRSTLEWEADGNELKWIQRKFGFTNREESRALKSAAELFTGPTYLWPSFDAKGWEDATRALLWEDGDARNHTDLVTHFGGYNYRG